MRYEFTAIEKKWRQYWEENPINQDENKPKYYCLDMFPYPSGAGLHVGHWRGYVLSDALSRFKILNGYRILHPMGWDAFGLPAENDAIKKNIHPEASTQANIKTFKRQLQEMSAVYDWSKEINTTDPDYYKWTQWIFVKMFEKGLAYEKEMPLNWCPSCKCVLANEEASGGQCERCGETVTKKMLRQWMLKITDYAERLLSDLDKLDWPEKVKKMQSDWIGKSYGAEIDFPVVGSDHKIKVFTTRPDTLFGATFMVLAPEHVLAEAITTPAQMDQMKQYIFDASTKSSVDRISDKEKTGVFTGAYGINPLSGEQVPIWVSDYVLADYGTGAIMCVPAHDERDFAFATKFEIPIVEVIAKDGVPQSPLKAAYTDEGVMINSGRFNGLNSNDAKEIVSNYVEENKIGKKTVNYKLRDWVFSRQRYWGEPIPIIHCADCGAVAVKESDLPVKLPNVESYQPTETGESPLSDIESWVNTACPKCGKPAKRETNTMPQWAGSSWYFLRYADPNNNEAIISQENMKKWLPVDMYVGGIEHAILHLLYARFYTKFLYDIETLDFDEPFLKLFTQGMINYHGKKMSKSSGHYVSPDELVERYGCDALRMYELFIGPPALDQEWDDSGIDGVFRYLNRTWRFVTDYKDKGFKQTKDMEFYRNKLIYEITARAEQFSFNTVVSGFMEYTNKIMDLAKEQGGIDKQTLCDLSILLAPFAPHIAEEFWQMLGNKGSVFTQKWPKHDETKMQADSITIAVQVNGKLRDSITVAAADEKDTVIAKAKEAIAAKLEGKEIVKSIFVPGKIVNFVIK